MNTAFTELKSLSPAEKLQLVEDLWDDIAATPEALPVLNWQKEELARRKAEYMQNPAIGKSIYSQLFKSCGIQHGQMEK